jgi:ADP-ribosylation factor protein 1
MSKKHGYHARSVDGVQIVGDRQAGYDGAIQQLTGSMPEREREPTGSPSNLSHKKLQGASSKSKKDEKKQSSNSGTSAPVEGGAQTQWKQQETYKGDPVSPRGELSLLSLPHASLLHIFSFLRCKDLAAIGLVSRRFNALSLENELWKGAIAREWSHKRMLKGYGKKHVLQQKNTKSKKISQQLMVIDYKQELKNHILFKRSLTKQAKANRKKASVWNFAKRDYYILLIGLDQSGKTTILYDAKAGRHELVYSIPTIGFNMEEVIILEQPFAIWDVGGLAPIRHTWTHYMPNAQGLIWVVDSSDGDRMREARAELHRVLRDENLRTRKLLVLANKQDLPGAWDARAVANYFQLHSPEFMNEWEWYVQPCSVMTASGQEALCAGLEWLVHDASPSLGSQESSVWQKLKANFT